MNRNSIVFALVFLFAAAGASAQVTFGTPVTEPGVTQWTTAGSNRIAIASAPVREMSRRKSCRIVALDGAGRIDAMDVTYSSASQAAVDGKSYRVTPHGVSYTTGGTPPAGEASFVRADNAAFGHFRALERIFAEKTFALNDSFTLNKNDAEELLNVGTATRVRNMTMTLRSVAGDVATYDVHVVLASNAKPKKNGDGFGGEMSMSLDGTLRMNAATVRPLRLDLDGAVDAGGASGTASLHFDYTF